MLTAILFPQCLDHHTQYYIEFLRTGMKAEISSTKMCKTLTVHAVNTDEINSSHIQLCFFKITTPLLLLYEINATYSLEIT